MSRARNALFRKRAIAFTSIGLSPVTAAARNMRWGRGPSRGRVRRAPPRRAGDSHRTRHAPAAALISLAAADEMPSHDDSLSRAVASRQPSPPCAADATPAYFARQQKRGQHEITATATAATPYYSRLFRLPPINMPTLAFIRATPLRHTCACRAAFHQLRRQMPALRRLAGAELGAIIYFLFDFEKQSRRRLPIRQIDRLRIMAGPITEFQNAPPRAYTKPHDIMEGTPLISSSIIAVTFTRRP